MRKFMKITSTVMAGLMVVCSVPAVTASAAVKVAKPKVAVSNVNKGVKITWEKASKAKKYVIYRKLSTAKKYTKIKTVSKAGSFVDKKAKAGKTYKYTVQAVNGSATATSKAQQIVRIKTPKVHAYVDVDYFSIESDGKVKGAKKIEVYRATVTNGKTGKYKKVGTFTANDEWDCYEDVDTTNAIYKFKIRAINGKSKSAFSKVKKIDYIQGPNSYSVISKDCSGIDITWGIMEGVEGFRIYRAQNDAKVVQIADIKLNDCTPDPNAEDYFPSFIYTDTNVEDGVSYTYYLEAYDGNRTSAKTEAFQTVEYKSYEYSVKVGEVITDLADELEETVKSLESIKKLAENKGSVYTYSVTVTSRDENVATVDSNNYITGVAPGKVTIETTVQSVWDDEPETTTYTTTILVTE